MSVSSVQGPTLPQPVSATSLQPTQPATLSNSSTHVDHEEGSATLQDSTQPNVLRTPTKHGKLEVPHTPSPIPSPIRNALLASPAAYHRATWVDAHTKESGESDGVLRRELKKMQKKPLQSVLLGSAEKDMEKIRRKRKKPDMHGNVYVTPTKSSQKKRRYKIHSRLGPDGKNRVFPTEGPNVVTMTGNEYCAAVREYQQKKKKDPTIKSSSVFRKRLESAQDSTKL